MVELDLTASEHERSQRGCINDLSWDMNVGTLSYLIAGMDEAEVKVVQASSLETSDSKLGNSVYTNIGTERQSESLHSKLIMLKVKWKTESELIMQTCI